MFSESINSYWAGPQIIKAIEKREQDILRIQNEIKNLLHDPAARLKIGLLMQTNSGLSNKTEKLEALMYQTVQPRFNLNSTALSAAVQYAVHTMMPEFIKLGNSFSHELGRALMNDFPAHDAKVADEIGNALGLAIQQRLSNAQLPAEKMIECYLRSHGLSDKDYELSELAKSNCVAITAAFNQYARFQFAQIDTLVKNRFDNQSLTALLDTQPRLKTDVLDACFAGLQTGDFIQVKDAYKAFFTEAGIPVTNGQMWFLLQGHLKDITGITLQYNAKRIATINAFRKKTLRAQRALAIENPVQLNILEAHPAHSTAKKHVTWAPQLIQEFASPALV